MYMDTQKSSSSQQKLVFCQQSIGDIINKMDSLTNELHSAWRGEAANQFMEILLYQRRELEMLGENLSNLAEIESQISLSLTQVSPKKDYPDADDG